MNPSYAAIRARFQWAIGLAALLLAFCAQPQPAAKPMPGTPPTVLVMGDSLSAAYGLDADEGWVALTAERIAERRPGWRVVNASISGETTAGGLARLPALLAEHKPALVIVELGANDGLRGLPLAQARANLAGALDAIRGAGARALLIGIDEKVLRQSGPVAVRDWQGWSQVLDVQEGARVLRLKTVTLVAEACSFDFVLVAGDDFEALETGFDAWWAGFQYGELAPPESGELAPPELSGP